MSFNIALSGLNVALADLSVTGNNIANGSTVGFKESRAEFADIYAVGYQGISSTAIGNGVRLASVSQQHSQGSIDFTSNNLDLAINGTGFFVLDDAGSTAYTRAGAFQVDRDGFVVNANSQKLQVFPYDRVTNTFNTSQLDDMQIVTSLGTPSATEDVAIGLNLQANVPDTYTADATFDPDDPNTYNHTTSLIIYDSLGEPHTQTTYYRKLDSTDPNLAGYTTGSTENLWEAFTYVDGDHVASLAGGDAFLTGAGFQPTDSTGLVSIPADLLQFDTTGSLTAINGTAVDPTDNQDDYILMSAWDPQNGADVIGGGAITAAGHYAVEYSRTTQFSTDFSVNYMQQDGYSAGRLSGIDVDSSGVIFARYSNGQSEILGKVALATFSNPQGLSQQGDTNWAESYKSGQALYGEAGTGNFGEIQSGALESSNVELTDQLVRMIVAQRNFQANAQMLSTEDQVTQTMINLR